MAFSYVEHVGDGVQTAFSFRFTGDGYGYFRESDIHVFVGGVEVGNWTLTAPNQLSFAAAPAVGARIVIRRIMPKDLPFSIWKRGNDFSPLTTNNNFLQQLYALQELYDGFMTEGFRFNQDLSMGGYRIKDVGDGVDPKDAVNVSQLMEANVGAGDAAERAKASADAAEASARAAVISAGHAVDAADRASASEVGAAASAQIAATAANRVTEIKNQAEAAATRTEKALADFIPLEQSAAQAADTAIDRAAFASTEADRAKAEADRAKASADSIDMTQINARLDAVDEKNTEQDGHISTLNGSVTALESKVTDVETKKQDKVRGLGIVSGGITQFPTGQEYIDSAGGECFMGAGASMPESYVYFSCLGKRDSGGDGGGFMGVGYNGRPYSGYLSSGTMAWTELLQTNRFTFVF